MNDGIEHPFITQGAFIGFSDLVVDIQDTDEFATAIKFSATWKDMKGHGNRTAIPTTSDSGPSQWNAPPIDNSISGYVEVASTIKAHSHFIAGRC